MRSTNHETLIATLLGPTDLYRHAKQAHPALIGLSTSAVTGPAPMNEALNLRFRRKRDRALRVSPGSRSPFRRDQRRDDVLGHRRGRQYLTRARLLGGGWSLRMDARSRNKRCDNDGGNCEHRQ